MPEDLLLGDDEEPPPPPVLRPVVWGVVALVLLALGALVVGRNPTVASYSAPAFADSDNRSFVPRPLSTVGLSLGLGDNLLVGLACPSKLGAEGVLSVSFRLENWGQRNVVLTDLSVAGSKHGLRSMGATGGGTCEQPSHGALGGTLAPANGQVYTFWFKLPAGCPKASHEVALRVRAEYLGGTTTTAVTREVGKINFTSCPASP